MYLSLFEKYFRCKGKTSFDNFQIKTEKFYRKTIIFFIFYVTNPSKRPKIVTNSLFSWIDKKC